ncbi:uncharacterized protein LOC142469318 [Ascaphus truei]|uniref:uncharacterized protein LOC142469318 n=1 Tax=Ascaphus truei TaxID=8439 RepID=UPI003F5A87FC
MSYNSVLPDTGQRTDTCEVFILFFQENGRNEVPKKRGRLTGCLCRGGFWGMYSGMNGNESPSSGFHGVFTHSNLTPDTLIGITTEKYRQCAQQRTQNPADAMRPHPKGSLQLIKTYSELKTLFSCEQNSGRLLGGRSYSAQITSDMQYMDNVVHASSSQTECNSTHSPVLSSDTNLSGSLSVCGVTESQRISSYTQYLQLEAS